MKLSQWAKKNNVTYRTAWSHFHAGLIPGAYALPTGTVVVPDESVERRPYTVVYARESSSDRKSVLEAQATRLQDYCVANGWGVDEVVKEIGSGLNDNRRGLLRVLSERKATRLVVEHQDRLARFGVAYINAACEGFGCMLVVVNKAEDHEHDLMQDFVDIVTSFCARIYGSRRSKRKTERLIAELKADAGDE